MPHSTTRPRCSTTTRSAFRTASGLPPPPSENRCNRERGRPRTGQVPVGNDDARVSRKLPVDVVVDATLAVGVEGGIELIEDQQLRTPQQHPTTCTPHHTTPHHTTAHHSTPDQVRSESYHTHTHINETALELLLAGGGWWLVAAAGGGNAAAVTLRWPASASRRRRGSKPDGPQQCRTLGRSDPRETCA